MELYYITKYGIYRFTHIQFVAKAGSRFQLQGDMKKCKLINAKKSVTSRSSSKTNSELESASIKGVTLQMMSL